MSSISGSTDGCPKPEGPPRGNVRVLPDRMTLLEVPSTAQRPKHSPRMGAGPRRNAATRVGSNVPAKHRVVPIR